MNKKVLPFNPLFPINVLNSLCKVLIIMFQMSRGREGRIQKYVGIIINPIKVLSQLKDKEKMDVDGSKTENKFIIIFN